MVGWVQLDSRCRKHEIHPRFAPTFYSLAPRPHPLTRKGIWWPLSDFLVMLNQQYWTNSATSCNHVLDRPTYLRSRTQTPPSRLCCATQVTWLMSFCSPDPFPRERVRSGHVCIICSCCIVYSYPKYPREVIKEIRYKNALLDCSISPVHIHMYEGICIHIPTGGCCISAARISSFVLSQERVSIWSGKYIFTMLYDVKKTVTYDIV